MRPIVTMREALADEALLGSAFSRPAGDGWLLRRKPEGDSWMVLRALLVAAMGERLTRAERRAFEAVTRRSVEPMKIVEEFILVIGRRGGKTTAAAALLVFLAALVDWSDHLSVGERGVALCLAANERQAGIVFQRAAGIIDASPLLRSMVTGRTADSLTLANGIDLMTRPASFRGLRGVTAVAVVCDEIAFWLTEGQNPDSEIINALRPALATTGGMLALLSSPYAEKGELYSLYRQHYGPNGDPAILVAQAASRITNPTLPQRVVDRALQRDPDAAKAEYLAEFRTDVSSFIDRALVEAAIDRGVTARPPMPGMVYSAFVDASSGRGDGFTAAVAHKEGDRIIVDCVFEKKPPFDASATVAEVAALLKHYRISAVAGDRYSIGFLHSEFARSGVTYEPSHLDRSEIYLSALPMFTSGRVRLVDNATVIEQFSALERKTGAAGRDRIDHPRSGHDDAANAVAGVIALLAMPSTADSWLEFYRRKVEQAEVAPIPPVSAQFKYSLPGQPEHRGDLVRVNVPPAIEPSVVYSATGRAYIAEIIDSERIVWMLPEDAQALCCGSASSNLGWREANPNLVDQLGLVPPPRPGIRISDMRQAARDTAPRDPSDRGGQVHDTLRLMGARR